MSNNLKVLFVALSAHHLLKSVDRRCDRRTPLKLKELGADVRVVIPGNKDLDYPTEYKGDFRENGMERRDLYCKGDY